MDNKQNKGLNRNTIDKYYTKVTTADLCLSLVDKHIKIKKTDLIIEPSAGNGSFISGIKLLSDNHIFYDLEPGNIDIIKQDYLTLDYKKITTKYNKYNKYNENNENNKNNKIHIIGNPPFGRQSTFAIKFIKKSCEYCDSISFILPKSFKKDSLKKTFPLNFHLIFESDLPAKSFLVDNVEHDVPCVFQIWEKKDHNREKIAILEPLNFEFVKKTENPDISFRRVGVNAGTIDKKIDEKNIQSHYFIKFNDNVFDADLLEKLNNLTFKNSDDTVGPKSISKQELIIEFNKVQ